jgi:hypothetical protein
MSCGCVILISTTRKGNKMTALENTKGQVYAYEFRGVKIKVEGDKFSVWKSALGYSLFATDNEKYYFGSLEETKAWISTVTR